jgi:minor curlin subunit
MKTISCIYTIALAMMMSLNSFSQNTVHNDEDIWLKQMVREYSYNQVLQNDLQNKAFIVQNGSNNNVYIDQKITGVSNTNVVYLLQKGSFNNGNIRQTGNSNEYNIFQYGFWNDMELTTEGNYNKSTLYQIGSENIIKQRLRGEGMNYFILQEGSRNELIHKENGVANPEYRIEQRGVGMKVIIENSNIYRK